MPIQIRNGVFETNSSSTHSFVLAGRANKYKISPLISFGEFGWGYDVLRRPEDKLSYVLTYIAGRIYQSFERPSVVETKKRIAKNKHYRWLMEMIEDKCGHTVAYQTVNADSIYPFGYIDHASQDSLDELFVDSEAEFKHLMCRLIFSNDSYITIDNDNH